MALANNLSRGLSWLRHTWPDGLLEGQDSLALWIGQQSTLDRPAKRSGSASKVSGIGQLRVANAESCCSKPEFPGFLGFFHHVTSGVNRVAMILPTQGNTPL